MGAADVVPGVSGGTMALILGVYTRLLEAIRSFDLALVRLVLRAKLVQAFQHVDGRLLVPLGIGLFAALMFFTRVVPLPKLIVSHPELVYAVFFGLVSASIVILLREFRALKGPVAVLVIAGAAFGWTVVNLVPVNTPDDAWFIFLSGSVAISAMMLPGISGSFVLLILNKYAYVFDAIGQFDFAVIVPFGLGIVTGVLLFSRLLVWLLHHFYERTLAFITGILLGSLWVLWPFQQRVYEVVRAKERLVSSAPTLPGELDAMVLASFALVGAGAMLVFVIERLARRTGASV
jgi:putative membrane protein